MRQTTAIKHCKILNILNKMKKPKLKVSEDHLLAMVQAFRDYKKLVEPIAAEQPQFNDLISYINSIENSLLNLNRFIHRKYDGLSNDVYSMEIEKKLIK